MHPTHPSTYDPGPLTRSRWRAALGALLCVGGIFLLLPATHWLSRESPTPEAPPKGVEIIRQPPPPPPRETPLSSERLPDIPAPEAEATPDVLPLSELDSVSRPGIGDAALGAFAMGGFAVTPNAAAEMEIFQVSELDRVPQVISSPDLVLPRELARDGIGGRVRLEVIIHADGKVRVVDVIAADHPRLIRHARRFAEQCIFESPTRGGRKVAAHYEFPIRY